MTGPSFVRSSASRRTSSFDFVCAHQATHTKELGIVLGILMTQSAGLIVCIVSLDDTTGMISKSMRSCHWITHC